MELVIENVGSKLSKENSIFLVESKDMITKVPTINLERIILNQGVVITSNALIFALEKNIDILLVNNYNEVLGKLSNEKFGSSALVRRKQYSLFQGKVGYSIGKYLISQKIKSYFEYLGENKVDTGDFVEKYLKELENLSEENFGQTIMGYEGSATNEFYKKLRLLLPEKYRFSQREHQNAKEPFNILLNYCYGVLYRMCETNLIKAGIDPYFGIIHTDNYNKKSFLFDFIEPFRIYAIEAVVDFIRKKYIRESHFSEGVLTREGKEAILIYFKKRLNTSALYNEKQYKKSEIIRLEAFSIARTLKEEENEVYD